MSFWPVAGAGYTVAGVGFASAEAGSEFVEGGGTAMSAHGLDAVSKSLNNEHPVAISAIAKIVGKNVFIAAVNRARCTRSTLV